MMCLAATVNLSMAPFQRGSHPSGNHQHASARRRHGSHRGFDFINMHWSGNVMAYRKRVDFASSGDSAGWNTKKLDNMQAAV